MKCLSKYAAIAATAVAAVAILAVPKASADSLSIVTTAPTGTDTVNWSQLGPDNTSVSNPFSATSTGGIGVTGTFAGEGGGQIRQEGPSSGWNGNFNPGDYVLWNLGNGPDTLSFNQGVSMAGAAIQTDFYGAFTAQIQAFDGTNLLGAFTENGNSNTNNDGSAIFLGLQDSTGANINSIVFSVTSCSLNCSDFAIDTLYLNGSNNVPVIPEPSSIVLLGTGMLALFGLISMRRSLNC
ncbi:MAG: PEP-CTERM sorting domain-containing protein [Acidobacteriaceae bacterium]